MKLSPKEIFGVSHLVLAVKEIQEGEKLLSPLGYQPYGEIPKAANPKEKAPFIFNTLSDTFSIKLLVHPKGYSSIELLMERNDENHEVVKKSPCFEFQFEPFRLLVHCSDLERTLPFWRALGFQPEYVEPNGASVKIGGVMPSHRLEVRFIVDREEETKDYLNQRGFVCLSFLCQDVWRVRKVLEKKGYLVSDCFSLKPFETPFQIFFARNHNGEIYEFLSVHRKQTERKKTNA